MNRNDFDIDGRDRIPHQRCVRADAPIESLEGFVRFLEELEAIFGPSPSRESRPSGDRFLL